MPSGAEKTPLLVSPGGVREDINFLDIPQGQWMESSNWLSRQGMGRPRPGYNLLDTLDSDDRVLGFGFHGAPDTIGNLVVHTISEAYSYDGTDFDTITGTWTAAAGDEPVQFAQFTVSGSTSLLRVNPDNAVDRWTGSDADAFTSSGAGAPTGRDIMVVGSRAVVIRADGHIHRVQWSGFNAITSWTSTDIAELNETPGELIACEAFGPNSGAIYTSDGIYKATVQAAKVPYRFDFVRPIPGPVSPNVLVPYLGWHYWLGKDGVVYRFDGSGPETVGDRLSKTIRETFAWERRLEAHGFAMTLHEPEIWFVYPDVDSGEVTQAICLNLRTGAMTHHEFADEVTASSQWIYQSDITIDGLTGTIDGLDALYPTIDSMGGETNPTSILGDIDGRLLQFGVSLSDATTAIPWSFTHPWKPVGGLGNRFYLDGIKSYWKKTGSALTVTLGVTATDSLGDADTETTDTFDISSDSDHEVNFTASGGVRGTWLKVKHSGSSQVPGMEHRGAAALAYPRGMV